MKKLVIFLFGILPLAVLAQNNLGSANDYDRIALDVFIPEQVENIPEHARSLITNKLTNAITEKGMAGAGASPRFLVTAKMELLTKDIAPTVPRVETYTFDIYLYIVDHVDKTIVSSTSFTAKGAGSNANKAYTNALRTLDLKNQKVDKFLDDGKRKIIEYYNSRCDFIIARAKSLATQNQFADALATLSGIPEVCKDCYMKALDEIGPIYQDFIDHDCQVMVNVASAVWASQPNSNGAMAAGAVLAGIDPDSRCYSESRSLIGKMEQKVLKDEKRDWSFMREVYQNEVMLEALRIKAFRDVGVAYGENQQPTYVYDIMWVFR
ncbi:MAG: hypothetical protein AB7S72_06200 [Draconibacterium sp.]